MALRFFIEVKKHQDKNGNTYHNARVKDLRLKRTYTTGVHYGYGSQWKQTVKALLKKKGLRTTLSGSNYDYTENHYKTMKAIKSF